LRKRLRTLVISSTFYLPLLSPVALTAQGPEIEGKPIREIQVQSTTGFTLEVIQRLTGLEAGTRYSAKTIRKSLDLLYETDLFKDIQVTAELEDDEVVVRYLFIEKTFLADLRIKRNWAFYDRQIWEELAVRIGDEFTEEEWKKAVSRLLALYQRHGYFQTKVTSELQRKESTNQIYVTIKLNEGARARIQETRFTGHQVFSNLRLWSHIRSLQGEFYHAERVEKDLQNLEKWYQSKGYLKSIIGPPQITYIPQSNEVILVYPIGAETRLDVQFEGNNAFRRKTLEPLLLFKEEQSYENSVFEASASRLKQFYQSKGYPFIQVRWSRTIRSEDEAVVGTFKILQGPLVCLKSVNIDGNQFFSNRVILKALSVRPGLNPYRCRVVDPDTLLEDIARMERMYREKGFLEAKVDADIAYSEGAEETARATASLNLTIDEGVQTFVRDISVDGNQTFTTSELLQKLKLRAGMPYNKKAAQADTDNLLILYNRNGFVFRKITSKESFSEDSTLVSLTYTINEGRRVRIGHIFVEGNTFTRTNVIERELKIRSGDPYNEEKIQLTRHRISRLGYLEDIRFHPIIPISSEPRETIKDMKLSVRERPPKAIEFGLGYGDFDRFRGFLELSHKNLAGTGRSLRLRQEASQKERKSALTYIEPWVFSLPLDARITGFFQTQVRPSYDLTTLGTSAGIEKDLTDNLKTSLVYQIEFNNFTNVPEEVLSEDDQGRVNIATLNPSVILDFRDDPFNPKSGTLSGVAFRVGAKRLGSQVQLRKATIYSNWFFPLTRWLVLALSARGGVGDKFGESKEVPPSERFFLGGRSTIRGYKQDELGITNETIVAKANRTGVEFVGGNAMLIGNAELRLFLPAGIGIVLFHDTGNVWLTYRDMNLSELKSTVGAGLRYNTPVGPLRLDVGYKLDREKNLCPECTNPVEESRYEVHFTLGHAF
jgi:outer membrane protein insertion porin family